MERDENKNGTEEQPADDLDVVGQEDQQDESAQDTSPENTEEQGTEDEGAEGQQDGEQQDGQPGKYAERIAKGQAKNVDAEMARLREEIAGLKGQLSERRVQTTPDAAPSQPEHFTNLRKKLHTLGLDELAGDIESAIKAESYATARQQTAGFEGSVRDTGLKNNLDSLATQPQYKIAVEKFRKEIETEIRTAPKEYWDNKSLAESVLGKIIARNAAVLFGPKSQTLAKKPTGPGKISETGRGAGVSGGGGVSANEIEDYANQNGLDISYPDIKQTVIETIKAKRDLQKLKEGNK